MVSISRVIPSERRQGAPDKDAYDNCHAQKAS
jgi:hypothetical protein